MNSSVSFHLLSSKCSKKILFLFKLRTKKKCKKEGGVKQQPVPAPVKPELVVDPNEKRHPAMTVEFAFKVRPTTSGHSFKAITIFPISAFH